MLLAIDIGNTNIVFALFKGESMLTSWRSVTRPIRTADEYAAFFFGLMAQSGIGEKVTSVLISSVVPETHFNIGQFCESYLGLPPVFIDKDTAGITIDLPRPEDVGADRLVNALAVIHHYQSPAIVLDFGTATTFDVIGKGGVYRGGVIAPGINLSINALAQAASKLPKISIAKPERVIGKATIPAMQSGVYWGYVGLIEGILNRMLREMSEAGEGENVLILATGGLAGTFKDDISLIKQIDNDLTLKGIALIHKKTGTA